MKEPVPARQQRRRQRTPVAMKLGYYIALCALVLGCSTSRAPRTVGEQTSGYLPVAGGRLFYEVRGSGPPVILIHGGFGDRRMWDDQLPPLAREFRVVRYDHRGFGRSSPPDSAYSPVADLELLLDHLDIDRAHLVGNSLGGSLAIDFALAHPERVRSLVVVASAANGYPFPQEDIDSVVRVVELAQAGRLDEALDRWLAHPMLAAANADPDVRARVHRMVRENGRIWTMAAWPTERRTPPAIQRLPGLRRPMLVIVGSRDTPAVRAGADSTARVAPDARRVEMTGAAHLPQMERPAEFNRILLEFLRRHSR